MNKFISPTDAPISDITDAIVSVPLLTERTTKFIPKNSITFTYLPKYFFIFSLSRI